MHETHHDECGSLRVVAALLYRNGKILFTQRQKGKHLPALWEFPGGKVEAGETDQEALKRELFEEVGIKIEVGPCCFETRYGYVTREVHLRIFRCQIAEGEPRALDVKAVRWISREDLKQLNVPPADVSFIHELASGAAPLEYVREKKGSSSSSTFKPAQVVYRPNRSSSVSK